MRCGGGKEADLVEQHAEGPPVDALAVALHHYELGREVLGRAAHGVRAREDALGEAKVDDLPVGKGRGQQQQKLEG